MRTWLSCVLLVAAACSSGAEHGNVFGNSIGSGHAEDDDGGTKGNPTMPSGEASGGEWDEVEDSSSSSGDDESSSDATAEPVDASSSEGGEASSGAPTADDASDPPEPTGDPMYAPCDPNAPNCADGFCLTITDQFDNKLGSFCTGPCALPDQDCDLPASGTAEPACLVSNEGPSICTLDCGGKGLACPDGMQCIEFPGVEFRCV